MDIDMDSESLQYYSHQFRVILIGDGNVGKSSILRRFSGGKFSETTTATIGVDYHARIFKLHNNSVGVKLQLWDTGGQERFRSITRSYYRNCAGCIIVYDISNRESFEHVKEWLAEARSNTDRPGIVYLLVGHKVDLNTERQVPTTEGDEFARTNNIFFIETSAKVFCNIHEAFQIVACEIYKRLKEGRIIQCKNWEGVKAGPFPEDFDYEYADIVLSDSIEKKNCCL